MNKSSVLLSSLPDSLQWVTVARSASTQDEKGVGPGGHVEPQAIHQGGWQVHIDTSNLEQAPAVQMKSGAWTPPGSLLPAVLSAHPAVVQPAVDWS